MWITVPFGKLVPSITDIDFLVLQDSRLIAISLQCRRILGGRKLLVYVRTVVTAIFVMKIQEDSGESKNSNPKGRC